MGGEKVYQCLRSGGCLQFLSNCSGKNPKNKTWPDGSCDKANLCFGATKARKSERKCVPKGSGESGKLREINKEITFNFRRLVRGNQIPQAVPGESFPSPGFCLLASFIKITRRNKEIWASGRAIYNADPNMIAGRKELERVRKHPYSHCPLALKNEKFPPEAKKQSRSQQAPSGCRHLVAIRGMCHLAPCTIQPPHILRINRPFCHWQNCCSQIYANIWL